MDQQTKASLKQHNFVTAHGNGLEWAPATRRSVILTTSILFVVIVLAVVVAVFGNARSNAARTAFGQAMEAYQAGITGPGQPPMPGTKQYASVAERAKAANELFRACADKYSWTKDGANARYFAGLTYLEQGQTQSARDTLQKVADGWDKELASLARLALADLDRQAGQTQQAIDLLSNLADHPTDAVPAGTAKLLLASLYTAEGKTAEAHKIYAQLKDKDAKGAAGIIAAEKLNPTPAAAGRPQR